MNTNEHNVPNDLETEVKLFMASDKGKRFIKRIEKAQRFGRCRGLMLSELQYLAFLHNNNLIDGSFDLYRLAYLQGYEAAKRDMHKDKERNA